MRILLLEPIHEEAVALLSRIGETRLIESLDPAHVVEQFRGADAVLTRGRGRMPREALLAGERLRVVARCGAGTDNIDVATASERGLPVLFSPDGTTFSVAEHAIMLMLAVGRRLAFLDRAVRRNQWEIRSQIGTGIELNGKTLGILGLGKIGGRIAELGAAFGMQVIYWSRSRRDDRYGFVELDDLFRQSDVLSVSLSLNPATRGIVSAARIGLMKPSAMLINTARGEMIDEEALVRALADGRLAGAGLDVLADEPPRENHPLFQFDNVIFTPHLGTITDVAYRKMCVEVAAQVVEILQGRAPERRYVRNPEVLKI
ncbi:MAG: hydroxyacid dehydrogenase [Blastocatellia bacterium]|nr:hydroxyacid dehydrogenase [Blastocatellia bacterium]